MKIENISSNNKCLFGACLFGEHYLISEGQYQRLNVFDLLNGTKVLEIHGKFNDKVIRVLSIGIDSIGLCFFANDGNYHLNMLIIEK